MWAQVAIAVAAALAREIAAAILDEHPGTELKDALDDAIRTIDLNTREALLESTKQELRANLDSAVRFLEEFRNTPTETFKLESAFNTATILVDRLRHADLINPPGSGLAGHPEFLIAASLRMAILQEMIRRFPESAQGEISNLHTFVGDSVVHTEDLSSEWFNWLFRRFSDLFLWPSASAPGSKWICYTFDGQRINTGVLVTVPVTGSLLNQKMQEAYAVRAGHFSDEWDNKIRPAFLVPSLEVTEKWKKLLPRPALVLVAKVARNVTDVRSFSRPWKPARPIQ